MLYSLGVREDLPVTSALSLSERAVTMLLFCLPDAAWMDMAYSTTACRHGCPVRTGAFLDWPLRL